MSLTDVSQFVRNANRFREVVTILATHGLADWLSGVNLPWFNGLLNRSSNLPLKTEQRIRVAITEYGTPLNELAQVLNNRPDLITADTGR